MCSVSHVFLRRCRLFCQSPSLVMGIRFFGSVARGSSAS
nr:MAG TPA: hypothetical protein [Caudoviricetes sp.]DAT79213.1 MAG TPA: hypothetical protein [Caudoviricetes sp.]DAW54307.1 MAG TPA: hypothetical protein [Caudoviricetes sp.]